MKAEVKSAYKLTEVGSIPEAWNVVPLSAAAEIRSGLAKNSNVSVADPIRVHYLRVANVQNGYLDLSEMSEIEVPKSSLKRFEVLPGDVLMNEGGDLDQLGRGSIWRGEFIPCIHQNHVFVVRSGPMIAAEYLSAWTQSLVARRYFMVAGKQTTNLASINKTSLGCLPVALPSLKEQRAIAAALSDMDALISGLDQLITKKRDIKQATMQQLLTGQTRLPGFSGEWEVKRLGDVLSVRHGKNQHSVEVSDGRYPILATGGEIGRTDSFLYDKPSVLIGRKGTIDKPVYREEPFWTVDTLFYTEISGTGNPKFIYYKFLMIDWRSYNEASGVPSLNASTIEAVAIDIPCLTEQIAIATILSDMDTEIATLEARRQKGAQLKQGMMQALLTGRIRLV